MGFSPLPARCQSQLYLQRSKNRGFLPHTESCHGKGMPSKGQTMNDSAPQPWLNIGLPGKLLHEIHNPFKWIQVLIFVNAEKLEQENPKQWLRGQWETTVDEKSKANQSPHVQLWAPLTAGHRAVNKTDEALVFMELALFSDQSRQADFLGNVYLLIRVKTILMHFQKFCGLNKIELYFFHRVI